MKRTKKRTVVLERGMDWLERSQGGESIRSISLTDGYDARTVRKYIELAKREIEAKEARAYVLRDALQQHYSELRGYADKLLSRIEGRRDVQFSEKDKYLHAALEQHLPNSPIWVNLDKHGQLTEEIAGLKDKIKSRVEIEIGADTLLQSKLSQKESGVIPGINAALIFQADQWSQGYRGLNINESLIAEPSNEDGFVNLHYGFSRMNLVREENVSLVRESLRDFETRVRQWDEFVSLEKAHAENKRIKQILKDDLMVIILRRIVPGRCKFCPV